MVSVKVGEKAGVQDVVTINPATLLRAVVLPVYKVLQLRTPSSRVEDSSHPEDAVVFFDGGRRRYGIITRLCGWRRQRFSEWFEE